MPLPPLTDVPDIRDPDNFPIKASNLMARLPGLVDGINASLLAYGPGAPFCAVTGTNALALTSGLDIGLLVPGQSVVFIPPNANTGPVTIDLDRIGAVATETVRGSDLPAGYIRAGQPVGSMFTGSKFRVYRDDEVGTTANGSYRRHANGILECWRSQMNSSAAGETTWTFPATFVSTPALSAGVLSGGSANLAPVFSAISASAASWAVYNVTNARSAQPTDLRALGLWY